MGLPATVPGGGHSGIGHALWTGGISAAAELNLGVAKAGVAGGIFIEINFDLHDPNKDGKLLLRDQSKLVCVDLKP